MIALSLPSNYLSRQHEVRNNSHTCIWSVYHEDHQILHDITVNEKYKQMGTNMSTLQNQNYRQNLYLNNQQCNILLHKT